MARYKAVPQEDIWGCGVACVASRIGKPYAVVKALLEKAKGGSISDVTKRSLKGLNLDPIVEVLFGEGIKVIADWPGKSWSAKKCPIGTIVLVYGRRPYDDGHYLLRVPEGWMDPWSNMPQEMSKEKPKPRAEIRADLSPKGYRVKVSVALLEPQG